MTRGEPSHGPPPLSPPAGSNEQREAEAGHGRAVRAMFGQVADRYDVMNRLMTFGQDRRWRRFVIEAAQLQAGQRVLDLATGTGDLAFDALGAAPGLQVIAADFTVEMMQVGRRRPQAAQVGWVGADALALPFADASLDVVIQGYLLRNLADIPGALREQFRVLRPGGRVVILETSPPAPGPMRPLVQAHLRYGIPVLSRLVSGSPDAYRYLIATTQRFQTPRELADLLRACGFTQVGWRSFMLGTQAVHWARKPLASGSLDGDQRAGEEH